MFQFNADFDEKLNEPNHVIRRYSRSNKGVPSSRYCKKFRVKFSREIECDMPLLVFDIESSFMFPLTLTSCLDLLLSDYR